MFIVVDFSQLELILLPVVISLVAYIFNYKFNRMEKRVERLEDFKMKHHCEYNKKDK